jgi:hypothetical protein
MTERRVGTHDESSPTANRAAVLVFHAFWHLCASRIALLRSLNPDVSIHCILAGDSGDHKEVATRLAPLSDSVWTCHGNPRWQWQHTDLVISEWYRQQGYGFAFDVLHVVQWDLLLFAPLSQLYEHVPHDAIALTGLTTFEHIAHRWHWSTSEPQRTETLALLEWGKQRWGYHPRACLGPGVALPRAFVDRYAIEQIPPVAHDELRLPMFGTVFGFQLVDTGFYRRWFDEISERVFNANGGELRLGDVRDELSRADGQRAFHPCRTSFSPEILEELSSRVIRENSTLSSPLEPRR